MGASKEDMFDSAAGDDDGEMDEPAYGDDEGGGEELPPDFEASAGEAFPELQGDSDRMMALWRAIKACVDGGKPGGLALIIGEKGKKR